MPADVPAKDAKVSLKKNVSQESFGGPARAKTGFMLFGDEKRPEVMKTLAAEAADGKPKMADIAKKLGELWKEVADKSKYEQAAAEQKKTYDTKLEEWKKTAEYKEFIKADGAHKKKKKGAAAKKEAQESGMPSRPASSYMQFSASITKEVMEELTKQGKPTDMKTRAGVVKQRWDALPQAEKDALDKKYAAMKDQYAKDLAAWNESEAGKKFAAAQLELDPKKALKASGQPSRPGSAYMLYSSDVTAAVLEELKAEGKGGSMKERSEKIKARFDALSAEEKAKYENKHKELVAKYEADMKEFKKTPEYKKFNALIEKEKKRASSSKPKAAGTKKRKVEGGAEPQPEESPEEGEEVSEEVEVDDDEDEESPEEAAEE